MKCKCGADIVIYPQWGEFAECFNCHRRYIIKDGKFQLCSVDEFKDAHRKRLIEFQKLNESDKVNRPTQEARDLVFKVANRFIK